MRFRPLTAVVLVALLAVAGCTVPSDGTPGSSGVPIMGQSQLTAAQLAAYYRAADPPTLPYRATGATIDELAQLFVDEGNRYNVRGDIAFAQSIIETGWFNFPDFGIVRPWNNNFAGIGACDACDGGLQFGSAQAGVRAQIQLLRNYADAGSSTANIPDPPVPELWGADPSTAAWNFNRYYGKGHAPLWNDMGNGNWASSSQYAPIVLGVYNRMLAASSQSAQCPPDGLLFGPLTALSFCPAGLRQPGRAIAANGAGGYYVLNGDGTVTAYHGAPWFGSASYDRDIARDLAITPDGNGYVVLDGWGTVQKFGSAADPATLGGLGSPYEFDVDHARSIAITPDGLGYVVLLADGTVTKWGSAASGPLAALGSPSFAGDDARSIAIMPDGAGYLVLDNLGNVWKFGSATQGLVGAGASEYFGFDIGRDLVIVSAFGFSLGYYVLDGWGGVWGTPALAPHINPRAQAFADRWRGATIVGGVPLLVRDDGTTATTS
ncbi:MAG TPA: glucosaminidase domain-containing protein [Acidimicrobiia bacterium]